MHNKRTINALFVTYKVTRQQIDKTSADISPGVFLSTMPNRGAHYTLHLTLYTLHSTPYAGKTIKNTENSTFRDFFCVYPKFLVTLQRNKQKSKIKEMENRRFEAKNEPEIVYSRSVKAGKRIYYLDVKKARNEDLYLCITESKRKQTGEAEPPQFEKHKVFLYKEDFAHFTEGLNDVIAFVQNQLGTIEERKEWAPESEETVAQDAANTPEDKSLLGTLLNKLKN